MRIGILTDALKQGGVERTVANLSRALVGHEREVVLYDASDITYDTPCPVRTLGLPIFPYQNLLQEATAVLVGAARLRRLKKAHRLDLCISFKEHPNLVNILSGGGVTVASVRECKSEGGKHTGIVAALVKKVISAFYARADMVVAVSNGVAEDLVANYGVKPERLKVVYNGCDCSDVREKRLEELEHPFPFPGPVIVAVGRLTRQKLHWQLIRAFSRVVEAFPGAGLVIVGAGEELDYLEKTVAAQGLGGRVIFTGFQKNPYKFVARCDLFVLSSAWEGFANVLLEAMACDVPVLSVDCKSGPREILAPDLPAGEVLRAPRACRYGIMVPELDGAYKQLDEPLSEGEEVLASAMKAFLKDTSSMADYRVKGRRRVADFCIERFAADWNSVFDSVTDPDAKPVSGCKCGCHEL